MHLIDQPEAQRDEDRPRYEFRVWSRDFGALFNRLRSLWELSEIEDCTDLYILSARVTTFSTKIRGNTLDVKQLIERRRPLERWRSYLKLGFPLDGPTLRAEVAPVLALEPECLCPARYDAERFIRTVVLPHPALRPIAVRKTRYRFSTASCGVEYSVATFGDSMLDTVAIEGQEVAPVLRMIALLGLRAYENLDYPEAIRRLLGAGPV